MPILFEFSDQSFLPKTLRQIVHGILHITERPPFGKYVLLLTDKIIKIATDLKEEISVVELGAGDAPLTEELMKRPESRSFTFIPCDLRPDIKRFNNIAQSNPSRVKPIYDPVDFSQITPISNQALYVCSGAFHHLNANQKNEFIKRIKEMKRPTIISEPLRHNLLNYIRSLLGFIPALLYPFFSIQQKRFIPAIFWCWIVPFAPIIFVWDGLISAIRIWTEDRWRQELQKASIDTKDYEIQTTDHYQYVLIYCTSQDFKLTSTRLFR